VILLFFFSLGATIPLLHTKNRKSTTTTTISKNVSSSREEAVSPKNKETSMEKGTPVELVVSKADFSKIQKYEVATVTAPSKKGKRKRKVLYDSWLSEYSSSVSDVDSPKKPKRVTQEPGLMNRMEQSEERYVFVNLFLKNHLVFIFYISADLYCPPRSRGFGK
jgi:hypothetical protein